MRDAGSGDAQPGGRKRCLRFRSGRTELAAQDPLLCFQFRQLQFKGIKLPTLLGLLGLDPHRIALHSLFVIGN
jgi:hypothetical protein